MRFPSVLVCISVLTSFCGEALAATAFTTTVPEDLLRELTGGSAYSDLPADFPPFTMPEGMSPIGSHQAPSQQLILLRTSRGGAESQLAVLDALRTSSGWIELPSPNSARQNGFVIPARELEPVTLCHDQYGIFDVRGEDGIENRVYIRRYAMADVARNLTCAQQNEARTSVRPRFGGGSSSLLQYLPSFEALIPAVEAPNADAPSVLRPPVNSPAIGIRGIPSAPGNVAGRISRSFIGQIPGSRVSAIRTSADGLQSGLLIPADDRSLRIFRRRLADSMETQGWRLDSQWNSADAAGSHWLRESTDGRQMLLNLHTERAPEDFYIVTYELVELGR